MSAQDQDVLTIEPDLHALVSGEGRGYRSFMYVLSLGDFSILIDATRGELIPRLAPFPPPRYLLLTHCHTRCDEALYESHFGLSVYLHPEDAKAPRLLMAEGTPNASRYLDPRSDAALAELGFRFLVVPGHTPGCTLIYWDRHGGVLFSSDTIIGALPGQPPGLGFPPTEVSDDVPLMHDSVRALACPRVRHVLPFHGEPLIRVQPDEFTRMWSALVT